MDKLLHQNKRYTYHQFNLEKDFEQVVIENASHIFGQNTIYIDIKKRIGDSIITIPDGYLIDFSFAKEPRLYIIENELSTHDPYKHIGSQLLKFAISYKASGFKIKAFLLEHIMANPSHLAKADHALANAGYRNIDNFLESIIFDRPVAAIVVIDQLSQELDSVLSQLTMKTDVIEFKTYKTGADFIYQYTPFNDDIREITESVQSTIRPEDLDTLVVAAKEEGFEREFLANNQWYAVRIHSSMIDRIKYIAAYQVAPISAITYYAEVSKIEKYNDTNKYILYFKNPAQPLHPNLHLDKDKKGTAPQGPRYTSLDRILNSKKLSEIF
jgi:hypothetical protein